jgi:hypothetical protein
VCVVMGLILSSSSTGCVGWARASWAEVRETKDSRGDAAATTSARTEALALRSRGGNALRWFVWGEIPPGVSRPRPLPPCSKREERVLRGISTVEIISTTLAAARAVCDDTRD